MTQFPCFASCLLLLCACASDSKQDGEEMPIATTWAGDMGTAPHAGPGNDPLSGLGSNDPHAGLGIDIGSNDPHAGLGIDIGSNDPHAGLGIDIGSNDPNTGLNKGAQPGMGSVAGLGLQAPDPDRKVDLTMYLAGQITVSEGLRDKIADDSVLFISVRPVNKVTGESVGSSLAVELLPLSSFPIPFHLSAAQTMVAGTDFVGDVVVYARVDGDGEATTNLSGDIEGSIPAAIPADGLRLVLDTLVP